MTEQTISQLSASKQAQGRAEVIDSGYHGLVERQPGAETVRKRYLGSNPREAAERARSEFKYLKVFSDVLSDLRHVYCPEPRDVDPDEGWVTMAHAAGVRVDRALADSSYEMEAHLDHIAENAATAAERYISSFGEPYYSLSTHNMLYDVETRRLGLIDFTLPLFNHRADPELDPFAITLGAFVGGTTFHTVRFRRFTWMNRGYWKYQKRLSVGLLTRVLARHEVSTSLIHDISARKYRSLARNGNILQKLWYATAGQVLFNMRSKSIINSVETLRNERVGNEGQ